MHTYLDWFELHPQDLIAGLLGFLTITVWLWKKEKNKTDALNQKFDYKKYCQDNVDDWIFASLASIALVVLGPTGLNKVLMYFDKEPVEWFFGISYLIGMLAPLLVELLLTGGLSKFSSKLKNKK